MRTFYTRAFCRDCRLHFEYALMQQHDVTEDAIVPCPRCDRPARYRPFQTCDEARYDRIEAEYERVARHTATKRATRRSKDTQWYPDDEEEYQAARKRRKRSRPGEEWP